MINHAQPLSISTDNDTLTKSDQAACELSLIHPINGAKVSPIFYQDNYIILMDWEDYTSPEGYPISYSLEIWNQMTPSDKMYYANQESYQYLIVDNLQIHDTYIWQVKAMDPFGLVCQSKTGAFIKIDPSPIDYGISYIFVKDKNCQTAIPHAKVHYIDSSYPVNDNFIRHPTDLFFQIHAIYGPYTLKFSAPEYYSKTVTIDHQESGSNHIMLSLHTNLQGVVKVLIFLSNNTLSDHYLCEIDLNHNNLIDLGDVILLLKELTNNAK